MRIRRTIPLAATLALLLLISAGLGEVVARPAAEALVPDVYRVASGADGLTLDVVVPEPSRDHRSPDTTGPQPILLEGYAPGLEGLPVRDLLIGLPPTGDVHVSVEALAPARIVAGPTPAIRLPRVTEEQGGLALQGDWEWQVLEDRAQRLPLADLVEDGFLREWRVARLRLAPMAYLGNGRWQITQHFRVRLEFGEHGSAGHRDAEPSALAPLSTLVEGALLNGEQAVDWRSSAPPVRSANVDNLPAVTWRIGITADGLYQLTYQALAGAGLPVAVTPPADYHLLWRGQEVALQEVGMGDGSLDPGDAFYFYARKFHGSVQDEKYTDENVYWLTVDTATPGLRMETRSVAPGGPAQAVTWHTATVRTEENNVYWGRWSSNPGTDTTWFWERVTATSPVTRHYPITLTALASAPHGATLRVEVAARNSSEDADPDHHLRLSVNGTAVGEDYWDGKVGRVITAPVDSSLLLDGENDIGLTLLTDVGLQDIYVDYGQITFRRQTTVQDDRLDLLAPFDDAAAYTLTGFANGDLRLYDLSDPLAPIALNDTAVVLDGPTWNLEFTDDGVAGQPYLALADSQVQSVPSLTRYEPDLDLLSSGTGADEIIIVPQDFREATLPLAAHRQAEGLRVEVVNVEDIYPLFNGGVFHPRAIRDFLAYAYEHWQPPAPAFVLLMGDGHFNFKGYNPDAYGEWIPVRIPPYLEFIDPWQGEVAVETRFAQIVGADTLPDLAIGRLPARSAQEAGDAVAKIITYEAGPTQDRLIFAADNPDADGDYEAVLDRLRASFVPGGMQQEQVYLTDYPSPINATLALTQTWSQGAAMVTFSGHGSVFRWAHEPLLRNTQIDTLQPDHDLPFVVTLDCLDGYWMLPPKYGGSLETQSMAEWMVMAADHGSIAGFSPAGLGSTPAEEVVARNTYDAIFNDGSRRLGELALAGQLTPIGYEPHLPQIYTLFGDPAGWLRMKPTSGLNLSPGLTLVSLSLEPGPSAEEALTEIEDQGGDASQVYRWLSESDTWQGHDKGKPYGDFAMELGQGYFVKAGVPILWTRAGWPPADPVPVALNPIWTLMGVPNVPGLMEAEDVLQEATDQGGDCSEIWRWYIGEWQGHERGLPFNNFGVTDDEGYFVKCANGITYVPGGSRLQRHVWPWPAPVKPEILQPVADPTISDVLVTNHRDVAFSVTWRTGRSSTGWVEYAAATEDWSSLRDWTSLGDDCGEGAVSSVHHVTLTGLTPETNYLFRVHSGQTVDDNGGALYQVTTRATDLPSPPYLAYGQVETASDGTSAGAPAVGALVRAWLVDGEGNRSEPLSAVVDGWGYWSLSLPVGDCDQMELELQAFGPRGSAAELVGPACEVQPVPGLVLPEASSMTEGAVEVYLPLITRQKR